MQMHDHVLSFFGFSRLPFGKHLQPADTFLSAAHQEALSRLSFGVADEDLLLLTGPIGCGKSVALAAFVSELDGNRYRPLYVRGAGLSEAQLYKAILDELKIDPPFFAGQAKQLFFKTIPELTKKPLVVGQPDRDACYSGSRVITFTLGGDESEILRDPPQRGRTGRIDQLGRDRTGGRLPAAECADPAVGRPGGTRTWTTRH